MDEGWRLPEEYSDIHYFFQECLGLQLAKFHKEWLRTIQKNRRIVIQCARGHGKTEVALIGYMTYMAFSKPGFQGIIVSKAMEQSTENLKRIRDHIWTNPLLATAIPDKRESDWSKTAIELKNGSRIMCKPLRQTIRGMHVDLVGCEEVGTWDEKDLFYEGIVPIANKKDGTILAIGTPLSKRDLLHELSEEDRGYVALKYPAIKFDAKGRRFPLWKNVFPLAKLDRIKKEIGELKFAQEYLCEPLGTENQLFPHSLIQTCFDEVAHFKEEREGDTRSLFYIGADFAMSGAVGADYTVYTVIEREPSGKLRLVLMERYKGLDYQTQKMRIERLVAKFRPMEILIDESSFGKIFFQEMKRAGIPVRGYVFTNESKNALMMFTRNMFENETIIIPRGTRDSHTKLATDVLIAELENFGYIYKEGKKPILGGIGMHDDCVISLALALYAAGARPAMVPYIVCSDVRRKKSGLTFGGQIRW